ncbi:replication protein [Vibrio penaeicida]|uniref:Bacteriophage lambda Replication protein O N-terminal domain-containing protein n=1 Tax=Vibrio penaeicida TaxID=104609 RepID=A0AAV5NR26_9VIBR|nr:replication protein [Vibrio penaeicida]GLQ72890.1 hypothetical protein GCM10007932_22500 [Vibrio penaeicida]
MNAQIENIVVFPQSEQETAHKASLKEGYYQVANQIGLALCKVSLSSRESRLVQAILFKTFGYHKSSDWICYEQLSELTGIDRSNIGKVKASLIQRRILLRDGKKIGINPVTSQWVMNIRNGSIRSAQREIQSLNGTSEEEKRVKTDSCQSQKRLKKTPSDSAQKESELTFEKVEIDSQKSQFRPPQKKNTLQKTNIKDLSTNSPCRKKPKLFKAFFDAYPAHRKGGSDAHVWKVWKAERLTESDAKLALEWLQMAARQSRDWERQSGCPFVVGITRFVRERRWLTPLPITQKRYLPPDFHSGDTSWADDLGW